MNIFKRLWSWLFPPLTPGVYECWVEPPSRCRSWLIVTTDPIDSAAEVRATYRARLPELLSKWTVVEKGLEKELCAVRIAYQQEEFDPHSWKLEVEYAEVDDDANQA